jgi:deazaflavin-dependent oxidoreductase (nitroreductase family)
VTVAVARTYRRGILRKSADAVIAPLLKVGIAVPQRTSYLMTTRGRKTGIDRTAPVNLVERDGTRWLVSPYGDVGWVHNLRFDPHLRLRRGRRCEELAAEEVEPEQAGPVLQIYVRQVPITAPFFDARATDPVSAFIAEAHRHPVFRLRPRSQLA